MVAHDTTEGSARAGRNSDSNLTPTEASAHAEAWSELNAFYHHVSDSSAETDATEPGSEVPPKAERSGAEARDKRPASGSLLLEVNKKQCAEIEEPRHASKVVESHTKYEARGCRCKSGFCDDCCESWGIAIRLRLIPVVESFTRVQMWTLTVDPDLFDSPKAAYEYLKQERCVSNLMRSLRKIGVLHSNRYFYAVEWHKNGHVHFHLILDASFVPKEKVQAIWDQFRPTWAGPKTENRPGFGIVRVSTRKLRNKRHAASYVTKYLIKPPENGYPEWVLDYGQYIRRYSTSRGFWGDSNPEEGDTFSEKSKLETKTQGTKRRRYRDPGEARSTIRERRDKCGNKTVLIAKHLVCYEDQTVASKTQFIDLLRHISFDDLKEFVGLPTWVNFKSWEVTPQQIDALRVRNQSLQLEKRINLIAPNGKQQQGNP